MFFIEDSSIRVPVIRISAPAFTISRACSVVFIPPPTMTFIPTEFLTKFHDTEEYKKYDLDKGLFAGGRFFVWITEGQFEAEYTIYGSGVPIIRSERGYLLSFKKP